MVWRPPRLLSHVLVFVTEKSLFVFVLFYTQYQVLFFVFGDVDACVKHSNNTVPRDGYVTRFM